MIILEPGIMTVNWAGGRAWIHWLINSRDGVRTTLVTIRASVPATVFGTIVGNTVANHSRGTSIVSGKNNFNPFVAASTSVKPPVLPAKEKEEKKQDSDRKKETAKKSTDNKEIKKEQGKSQ